MATSPRSRALPRRSKGTPYPPRSASPADPVTRPACIIPCPAGRMARFPIISRRADDQTARRQAPPGRYRIGPRASRHAIEPRSGSWWNQASADRRDGKRHRDVPPATVHRSTLWRIRRCRASDADGGGTARLRAFAADLGWHEVPTAERRVAASWPSFHILAALPIRKAENGRIPRLFGISRPGRKTVQLFLAVLPRIVATDAPGRRRGLRRDPPGPSAGIPFRPAVMRRAPPGRDGASASSSRCETVAGVQSL